MLFLLRFKRKPELLMGKLVIFEGPANENKIYEYGLDIKPQ